MVEGERLLKLQLIRSPRIGPITYRQLIARFGSAAAALDALPRLALRGGGEAKPADLGEVRREAAMVARLGARYLFLDEGEYPPLLAQLDNAPPAIIVRGDPALAARPCVAIVGARNASAASCRFARVIAQDLAAQGVSVVSGLARGIDTAAHVGSLSHGTIGVIASGIDIAFPPENRQLQDAVAEQGLLIAEQVPGTEPIARHFPSRNRIIAGIAQATLVVEAAPRSGSLITARLAGEMGRDVMAVPGSPMDPRAQGCNQLIREGAVLVQSAADVLELLRPIDPRAVRSPQRYFAPELPLDADDREAEMAQEAAEDARQRVQDLLSHAPVAVDELVRQSGETPGAVQMALLELELGGRLTRHAGARVSLR